jgi:hypothetical protein
MSIAFVQSANVNSSGTSVTIPFSSNNAAGNLLVVGGRNGTSGSTLTFSDSNSNTYTKTLVDKQEGGGSPDTDGVAYVKNCAGGANTVTFASTNSASMRAIVAEYFGIDTTSPVSGTPAFATDGGTPSTTLDSGNTTTTDANCLIIGFGFTVNGASSLVASGGATQRDDVVEKISLSEQIVSSTGNYKSTWSISSSDNWLSHVVAFKQASGGGGGSTQQTLMLLGVGS